MLPARPALALYVFRVVSAVAVVGTAETRSVAPGGPSFLGQEALSRFRGRKALRDESGAGQRRARWCGAPSASDLVGLGASRDAQRSDVGRGLASRNRSGHLRAAARGCTPRARLAGRVGGRSRSLRSGSRARPRGLCLVPGRRTLRLGQLHTRTVPLGRSSCQGASSRVTKFTSDQGVLGRKMDT